MGLLLVVLFVAGPALDSKSDSRLENELAFGLGNSRFVSRPVDEAAIRGLVDRWNRAFARGDIAAVAAGFDDTAGVGDALGISSCCGPRTIESSIRRDLKLYYPAQTHAFSVEEIWFVWKATIVYFNMPWFISDVAVVKLSHRSPSLASGTTLITAVARKNTGRWQWHAVWPMMPAVPPLPAPISGALDDTIWYVPAVADREAELLIFDDGRLLSGTSYAKTMSRLAVPDPYSATVKDDTITWSVRQESQKDTYREWKGVVTGDRMTGEDVLPSPKDDIVERWNWTAVRIPEPRP